MDTIQTLRADDDDELQVQCDVFEEELNADSEAIENMNDGKVNVNDHTSVFTAIYKRVRADIAAENCCFGNLLSINLTLLFLILALILNQILVISRSLSVALPISVS